MSIFTLFAYIVEILSILIFHSVLISHNERKVTCKHPVSGFPSQDNCIFVVNEQ